MYIRGLVFLFLFSHGFALQAQLASFFTVSDNQEFDKIKFSLNATNGQCLIESGLRTELMDIHTSTADDSSPQFKQEVVNRTKEVSVALGEDDNISLSSTISRRMFSAPSVDDYTWKVYLSKLKPLDLDLNYAVGDTYIDLSDLPIEKLKMRSGSANVKVNYKSGFGNLMKMDTFFIKVDMGTFEASNLYLCKSAHIITDVGFGKVKMDFKDAEQINTIVTASVGAGKLEVTLPQDTVPVRININESPLCNIKMPGRFKKVGDNIFETPGFSADNSNLLSFNVDVAVGNIVFK